MTFSAHFQNLGGPVFISIWAISPLWLSFGVEAFNLALTINKMLFFPFFCGGRGRGSIFSGLAVVGFFFPKALATGIIPEPTVNQIHKLSLSEGEPGRFTHQMSPCVAAAQTRSFSGSMGFWVSQNQKPERVMGRNKPRSRVLDTHCIVYSWQCIFMAECLIHTAMNIQCYRFRTDVYSSFSHNFQIVEATKMNR